MYMKTAGMGAAYENGVLIPSTSDPANTPIVMNPSPGQNLQIAASQVPLGTLSSSGQACNTAGGYVWNPATALCELTGQPAGGGGGGGGGGGSSGGSGGGSGSGSGSSGGGSGSGGSSGSGSGSASPPLSLFGLSTTQLLIAAAVIAALFVVSR